MQWSLKDCIKKFMETVDLAFTPRGLSNGKIAERFMTLKNGSKYSASNLHRVLKDKFSDAFLFGSPIHNKHSNHVAVISTSEDYTHSIALTNYSRKGNLKMSYKIEFSNDSKPGLKIWEAACATSAAPAYFKPFKATTFNRTYLDGALYHNNPVSIANSERRLLWTDVANQHPDILLSLGSGLDSSDVDPTMPKDISGLNNNEQEILTLKGQAPEVLPRKQRKDRKTIKKFVKMLVGRVKAHHSELY